MMMMMMMELFLTTLVPTIELELIRM